VDNATPQAQFDDVTVLNARAMGGPKEFTGRFIFASLATVQKPEFCQTQGKNITCVVNCIGKRGGTNSAGWLPSTAGRPIQVFIDVHNKSTMATAFNTATESARQTLKNGQDVLVHCRFTFHRGPAICAGMYQKLCGAQYQVEGF